MDNSNSLLNGKYVGNTKSNNVRIYVIRYHGGPSFARGALATAQFTFPINTPLKVIYLEQKN